MNHFEYGKTLKLFSDKTADQMDRDELIFFIGFLGERVEILSQMIERARDGLKSIADFYRSQPF